MAFWGGAIWGGRGEQRGGCCPYWVWGPYRVSTLGSGRGVIHWGLGSSGWAPYWGFGLYGGVYFGVSVGGTLLGSGVHIQSTLNLGGSSLWGTPDHGSIWVVYVGVCWGGDVLIGVWGPYGGDLGGGVFPYLGSVGRYIGVWSPIQGSHWGRGAVSHSFSLPSTNQLEGAGPYPRALWAPPPGNSHRQWAPTWGGGQPRPPCSLKAKTPKSDPPPTALGTPPQPRGLHFRGGGSSKIPPPPLSPPPTT